MQLKQELIDTMTLLGISESELEYLKTKMLSTVIDLEASLTAIEAQISTLNTQKEEIQSKLAETSGMIAKLIITS